MKIYYLTFDLDNWVYLYLGKDDINIAQHPLHYIIYAPAKFEVNTSNGFGGDALTRKYII